MSIFFSYKICQGFFQNRTICLRYFERKHVWNIRHGQIMKPGYRRLYYLSNVMQVCYAPSTVSFAYNGVWWDNIWTKNGHTIASSRRLRNVPPATSTFPALLMYLHMILSCQIENSCLLLCGMISYSGGSLKYSPLDLDTFSCRWLFVESIFPTNIYMYFKNRWINRKRKLFFKT